MKSRLIVSILALLVVGAAAVSAQQIDGEKSPEQIPITLALRLWLSGNTHDAVIQAPRIGLSQADAAALTSIMMDHRQRLDVLSTNYKRDAHGNRDQFWGDYTNLTAEHWAKIQTELSRIGVLLFTRYLEGQKAFMHPSAYDAGLGAVAKRNLEEAQMVASMSGMAGMPPTGMTSNYSAYNAYTVNYSSKGLDAFFVNGALDSTNWTTRYGSFSISNGNLSVASGGGASGQIAVAYWSQGSSPSWQQCSVANLGTIPSVNGIGPAINISATTETYYAATWYSGVLYIVKSFNGTITYPASYTYTPATGDTANLCNDGIGNVTVKLNSNTTPVMSIHDTSISSGYPGIRGNSSGTKTTTLTVWTGGSDITSITVNANVTGDTICGVGGFCNGVTHTPSVANYNALRGGTVTGPGVPPANYVDTYNNLTYPISDFDGNPDDPITVGETVICTTFGVFFQGGGVGNSPYWVQMELGSAMWKNNAPTTTNPPYIDTDFSAWCSTRTTPTDFHDGVELLIEGTTWQPAAFIEGTATRLGGFGPFASPWLHLAVGTLLDVLPTSKPDCTQWDNGWIDQIKGGRILINTGGPQPRVPPLP
jgi:hypothetical protein